MRIVVLTFCIAVLSGVARGDEGVGSIHAFGRIKTLGATFDPLCPCGTGIQLINDVGDTLEISIGPSKSRPHGGFRIGSINPADAAAVVVLHGSTEESALVAEIWRYLDTHWLYSEIRRLQGPNAYVNPSPSDWPALELLRVINAWQAYTDAQRWLDNNTSREEQARIFALPYAELQSDFEREVFENVCTCQGRVFYWGPYSTADSTRNHAGSCQ
ncbi:MAG: hypothetical protein IPK64_18090 [bacterium]|nr:hypothetical protein [bacterium]